LTTRVHREHLAGCLFGSIHESGHAMYNQGVSMRLARTPLWAGVSPGVHESQSRLWENLIGRSRGFWKHFFPELRAAFPEQLARVDSEGFYRAVNAVKPSYIRVEADEVTYNLHILLRYEIERDLLENRIRVADVPEAWNAKLGEYLGLPAPPAADGPLQDIHWTDPILGGFVGYTIGNLIGAQLMETVREALPQLDAEVERGEFGPLREWLRDNVYATGRTFTPDELVQRVTGRPLTAGAWIRYIHHKFGDLYGLD